MQGKDCKISYLAMVAPAIMLAAALLCILFWPLALLLPAVALYLDLRSQVPSATATLVLGVIVAMVVAGSQYIFLMPIALYIGLLPVLCLLIMRLQKLHFFEGLGYAVTASLLLVMTGVLVVYFAYGQRDLITLAVESIRSWLLNTDVLPDRILDSFAAVSAFFRSQDVQLSDVSMVLKEIQALSRMEKIDIIMPLYREMLSQSGASALMLGGSMGGALTWYLPLLFFGRKRSRKELPLKPPPFVVWRLHRWVVNVLMLVLLVSIILSYTARNAMLLSGALALQRMVMAILSVQGMAVIAWLLRRKKVPGAGVAVIIVLIALVPVAIFSWVGFFDLIFNIRVFAANRGKIRDAMNEMRKNIEKDMQDKVSKDHPTDSGEGNAIKNDKTSDKHDDGEEEA